MKKLKDFLLLKKNQLFKDLHEIAYSLPANIEAEEIKMKLVEAYEKFFQSKFLIITEKDQKKHTEQLILLKKSNLNVDAI
jgi:hypothetical protein